MTGSDQYIVVRTQEKELFRLPLDLVDRSIRIGVKSLNDRGMLRKSHICLIAVPRGSLTSTFTYIYEVVRTNDWSVLPLGGSVDSQDISQLSNAYNVDTLVVPVDAIESIFTTDFIGQFDTVRHLLYVSGLLSRKTLDGLKVRFPHFTVAPFIYYSDIVGPIGLPIIGSENAGFTAIDGIHLEVKAQHGEITDSGSGKILASVLGHAKLTRSSTEYKGTLAIEDDKQIVRFDEEFAQ
jgi:hypothetical protein